MKEQTKNEQVIVTRNGTQQAATTTHLCYTDILNQKTGEVIGKGPLVGVGIRLDSGHELYAQPSDITPATAAELKPIRDRENAAIARMSEERDLLWAGGGPKVYTA